MNSWWAAIYSNRSTVSRSKGWGSKIYTINYVLLIHCIGSWCFRYPLVSVPKSSSVEIYKTKLSTSNGCSGPPVSPLVVQEQVSSIQCTEETWRVYSVQYIVYSIQCTIYSIQCTVYSIQYTVYSIQYTVYSIQCTVYSVQYTVKSIQCAVHSEIYC